VPLFMMCNLSYVGIEYFSAAISSLFDGLYTFMSRERQDFLSSPCGPDW
jgi:hypothetical protein